MKELEEIGMWWIPQTPEIQVYGFLKFSDPTGIHLELIGSLQKNDSVDFTDTCPIILGITQGKLITLCENRVTDHALSFPGHERFKYTANTAFIGAHFFRLDEVIFHRISVEYSYLADWANLPIINKKKEIKSDEYDIRGINFEYIHPETIRGNTEQGVLSLVYTWQDAGQQFQINFNQSATFEMKLQEDLSFDKWRNRYVFPLQNFITLATDRPNSIIRILVFSRHGDRSFEDSSHFTKQDHPIEVIYRNVYSEARRGKRLSSEDLLFELRDIKEKFEDVMSRWLSISSELDSVCNLFFSTRYSQKIYLENHFLNIVQAVESYHRRRRCNQILPKDKHKEKISRIIDNASEEDKEWLKQKLAFSNEPSLKERLIELVQETQATISPLILDEDAFIKQVRDTRNYLTHYDQSLQEKAVKGEALFWLTYTLEVLLQTCFLRELGFSSEQCLALFKRNSRYKFCRERHEP